MLRRQRAIYFDGESLFPIDDAADECIKQQLWTPSRTPSPTSFSSSSSGIDDDDDFDELATNVPELLLAPTQRHYEFWDAGPHDFFFLGGNLQLQSEHITRRPDVRLEFSHFELEVKTHGRQGRFSRDSIWNPSYIDWASSPVHPAGARHLTRTRTKSFISFSPRRFADVPGVKVDFKIGLPQDLFRIMRTRHLRLSGRAIFLRWEDDVVGSTEVVEAEPMTVSVSHLQLRDYL